MCIRDSPRVVPILFKLEGGSSPAKEIWVDAISAGNWEQYSIDFSGEALSTHKKIAIFFNGGQDPQAGDVYYIDDINWNEAPSAVLEDFEQGAFLPWAPLDDQALLHGAFAVIPDVYKRQLLSQWMGRSRICQWQYLVRL